MERFRDRLVFKAHRLLYHSTLGLRVIDKTREGNSGLGMQGGELSDDAIITADWHRWYVPQILHLEPCLDALSLRYGPTSYVQ